MKGPSPLKHGTSVIEQSDVSEDGAETVVGVGLIVLQGQGPLEFINGI